MDKYQLINPSTLMEAIEVDFLDISNNHLQFWSKRRNLQREFNTKLDAKIHENVQGNVLREKRSGLEKILQVETR